MALELRMAGKSGGDNRHAEVTALTRARVSRMLSAVVDNLERKRRQGSFQRGTKLLNSG
jgi:hypothetical protein